MARVFLFNPQTSVAYGQSMSVAVNAGKPVYVIPSTQKNPGKYTPNSRSGNRVSGQPAGNDFGDNNDLVVGGGNSAALDYQLNIAAWPGDIVTYFFFEAMAVINNNGSFLAMVSPTDSGSAPAAAADFAAPAAASFAPAQAASDTANGSVYIFNLFAEDMTVSLNGGTAGTVPAWGGTGSAAPYTPSVLVVDRVLNADEGMGKFFNGSRSDPPNGVSVHWQENPASFQLSLRHYPMGQDLLLYLLSDCWMLVTQWAVVDQTGPYDGGKTAQGNPAIPAT